MQFRLNRGFPFEILPTKTTSAAAVPEQRVHLNPSRGAVKAARPSGGRQGAPPPPSAASSCLGTGGRLLGKDGSFLLCVVGIYCAPRADLKTLSGGYTVVRRAPGARPDTLTRRTWRRAGASTVWAPNAPRPDSQALIHCPGS